MTTAGDDTGPAAVRKYLVGQARLLSTHRKSLAARVTHDLMRSLVPEDDA